MVARNSSGTRRPIGFGRLRCFVPLFFIVEPRLTLVNTGCQRFFILICMTKKRDNPIGYRPSEAMKDLFNRFCSENSKLDKTELVEVALRYFAAQGDQRMREVIASYIMGESIEDDVKKKSGLFKDLAGNRGRQKSDTTRHLGTTAGSDKRGGQGSRVPTLQEADLYVRRPAAGQM